MLIEIRRFATLPPHTPENDRLDVAEGTTAGEAMHILNIRSAETLILVNGVHAGPDRILNDGDRLAGWACLNGIDPAETVLFVSARITSSLYAKARRAGFSFLISRSAVTSTPVEMARQQNRLHPAHPVTVVGFCRPREERLTVFAGEGRIA